MIDKLLENNTVLKVLSVIVAIFIWIQAQGFSQPPIQRTFQVAVTQSTTLNPRHYTVSVSPAAVSVEVRGPASTVDSTTASDVSATVNLKNIKGAGTFSGKVTVYVPQGVTPVSVQPSQVVVTVVRLGQKQVPVVLHHVGALPTGYEMSGYTSSLKDVTISGPAAALKQVKSVSGTFSIASHTGSFTQDVVLQPVNGAGRVVPKVQVNPPTASVAISVQPKPPEKVLPVVSQLTGQPATGYAVTQISVYPSSVTISGKASTLSNLTHLVTQSINVLGQTSSVTVTVPVKLPSGTKLVSSGRVTVTVTIVKKS